MVVPQLLDLTQPIRIWAGYAKSPELFAANGRPKRVQVRAPRLRAVEPDPHDATGSSSSAYVEPVVVAGDKVALRDFNGHQVHPVPQFQLEHCRECPHGVADGRHGRDVVLGEGGCGGGGAVREGGN